MLSAAELLAAIRRKLSQAEAEVGRLRNAVVTIEAELGAAEMDRPVIAADEEPPAIQFDEDPPAMVQVDEMAASKREFERLNRAS